MTTVAHDAVQDAALSRADAVGQVTVGRVVASELIKLRTARSMIAALATAGLLVVGAGVFGAVGLVVQEPAPAGADPLGGALTGVDPASYAVATLGVLAVTSEYASGTIKTTLAAVPRRGQLVLGKAMALAAVTLVVMFAAVVATFFIAQAVLSTAGMSLSPAAPGVARVLAGSSLYLTGVTLLAAGLGWLLRSTAGALAALFGVLAVLPVIGLFLPERVAAAVVPYLPGNAGTAVMQLAPGGQLPAWAGLAVFAGYVTLTLAAATAVLRRRDA